MANIGLLSFYFIPHPWSDVGRLPDLNFKELPGYPLSNLQHDVLLVHAKLTQVFFCESAIRRCLTYVAVFESAVWFCTATERIAYPSCDFVQGSVEFDNALCADTIGAKSRSSAGAG